MYQITWRGTIHDSQGYARAGRGYILALDKAGVDIRIEPVNYGTPSVRLLPEQASRIKELIIKPIAKDKKRVLIQHSQPYGFDPLLEKSKGFDKVILNTVWETTKIPESWFPNINNVDVVLVPSIINKKALEDSGVTVPIHIVPHGSDIDAFNPDNSFEISGSDDTFNFLSVFKWEHRKAPEVLLQAFWQEFTQEDNVSLIIKSSLGGPRSSIRQVRNVIAQLKSDLGFGPNTANILYSGSHMSEDDLVKLYGLADVFVLPSRGEGVGLPYMEAMASEVPVIATGWGGQTDFINEENGYLVDYEMVPSSTAGQYPISPTYNVFTKDMMWAEPSVEHLRKVMRHCYENQEEVKAKGMRSRSDMMKMTWNHIGIDMKKTIEEVL
jgi:glycosyltransferase involved in cell wall biosynthesis